MKKTLCLLLACLMVCGVFAGCSETKGIDYLALVNKENPLPEGWEEAVEVVHMKNSLGDDVEVEKKAYDAYLKLKEALASEGVYVDLDSARRTVAAQQDIVDRFTEKYGEDYVKRYVAAPGYSEHHTGLALDLYLNIDGEDVYLNEDMVQYPEIWAKIHEKLPEYGFILRYPEGKEAITGYSYEPWHIRFVNSADVAGEISSKGITLEEYLNKLPTTDVAPPTEAEAEFTWTRQGYFSDENDNMLSVTYMEDVVEPGWYVGVVLGELWTGAILPQEGSTLHGDLNANDETAEPLIATLSEEGEDGLLLEIDGGESYHFTPMDMPEATIFVTINTEGLGAIEYAEGEVPPEIDPEYPYQSAQINLAEPAVYSLTAQASEGWHFVKWTKDGADFSEEPELTLELSESMDLVAVFESDDADTQDVMEYLSPEGWSVRYDPELVESVEGDGFVDFVLLEDPANKMTVRFVEDKQPEELLYEVCENWECEPDDIERTEGFFPGAEGMWGYWRTMAPREDGLSRTAIAGEYNGGVLLFEEAVVVTGDDEVDFRISDTLESIIGSVRYDHFDPQTMYDYYPGIYPAEQDGFVYSVELREDHTGVLHFQDEIDILWSTTELFGDDFSYEYTIEGDALLLSLDGEWMQFDRQ